MVSPRTNRSTWYVESLMLRIVLLTLTFALFVTSCGSPPIQSTVHVTRSPDIPSTSRTSTVIVIGTITGVLPARWTTADGRRPANPQTAGHTIFRPVTVDVEEYLKGENTEKTLQLYAWGGRIGNDMFEQLPDKLYEFQAGERVVVFLKELEQGSPAFTADGSSLWSVQEHYTITGDNQAKNYYQTLPLDELRATVQAALQP